MGQEQSVDHVGYGPTKEAALGSLQYLLIWHHDRMCKRGRIGNETRWFIVLDGS